MQQEDYWAIAEADIEIQNPVTDRKLRLLEDYCDVRDGIKVIDIGCGKAWLMRQWAERYDIEGTGLETNPAFLDFARNRRPKRGSITY
ncbi:MAG: methionine biosynthesis protein MetW, partial [Devosia sp.]